MSAMAAAPAPCLDSVLSFGPGRPVTDEPDTPAFSDAGSDYDGGGDAGFEFAFAPPLAARGSDLAPADDLFAHGRILPAYPVFDRRLPVEPPRPQPSRAPPSPDTYCAWASRSAPGSPARDPGPAFPKSASTGEARRFWRLRGLVSGAGGRSHSDGKEKFVFLQPAAATPSKVSGNKAAQTAEGSSSSSRRQGTTKPSAPAQKQSKKKGGKSGAVTEMDLATAHKLFYGKQGAGGALAGDRRQQQQRSYLPYRPGIVGFFASAHALGRSHHPY